MPKNPKLRVQRQKAIVDLITKRSIAGQLELQDLLKEQGILTTQSSISRDLKDLGVRRIKGRYILKPWRTLTDWDFEAIIGLIEQVTRSGPYLTVVLTSPDAAKLVARAIDEAGWDEVAGTVAGEDTVFIATPTQDDQTRLYQRFAQHLRGG